MIKVFQYGEGCYRADSDQLLFLCTGKGREEITSIYSKAA